MHCAYNEVKLVPQGVRLLRRRSDDGWYARVESLRNLGVSLLLTGMIPEIENPFLEFGTILA
jgi:hypothetical protein